MIKGVNKVIIEVNDTKSDIFEKAVFYVRPEFSNKSQAKLQNHAQKYIDKANLDNRKFEYDLDEAKRRHRRFFLILTGYFLLIGITIYFIFS